MGGDAQRRATLSVGFQSKNAPGRLRRAALAILSTERLRKASRASISVAEEINSDFHRRSFAVSKTMNDLKAQCDKINAELAQLAPSTVTVPEDGCVDGAAPEMPRLSR